MPYFDNDYWPGDVELFLQSVNGSTPQKKGGKAVLGRVLRAMKRGALIENPKDILFMYQVIFLPDCPIFLLDDLFDGFLGIVLSHAVNSFHHID